MWARGRLPLGKPTSVAAKLSAAAALGRPASRAASIQGSLPARASVDSTLRSMPLRSVQIVVWRKRSNCDDRAGRMPGAATGQPVSP